MFAANRIETLVYWIQERERIRVAKEVHKRPPPWTDDPLMANTRWCNVRRMDDKVSRWLVGHFYRAPRTAHQMVTAAALARLINWPDTIEYLYPRGWSGRWDPEQAQDKLLNLFAAKKKVFTGVYIINAASATAEDREGGGTKIKIVVRIIDAVHQARHRLVDSNSMQATHARLKEVNGIGSFMAGQMVADLRHVVDGEWADRNLWAPKGPGSTRGMLWLMGEDRVSLSDEEFGQGIATLIPILSRKVKRIWEDRQLEAHDVQNCLCELSKYVRLQDGGRSKNKYEGGL